MISFNGNCTSSGIDRFYINSSGDLIVVYTNGVSENLGHVVGADGKNFYPDEVGFVVPDGQFRQSENIGWSYLSLANNDAFLYFKTSAPNVDPSTWNSVHFGKGDPGTDGKSFKIDGSGTTLPTTATDGFTFLKEPEGSVYYYRTATTSWDGPYQWRGAKGDKGDQGVFMINSSGTTFPVIDDLPIGYTFYKTDNGYLYFVTTNIAGDKVWTNGIPFKGDKGDIGLQGPQGVPGANGQQIVLIQNTIKNVYNNTLLVIGTCPAGYVVSNIEVKIKKEFGYPVQEMFVRFGGTIQDESTGVVIADNSCFDINVKEQYIVNEVNHQQSAFDEIISCVFDDAVLNSPFGELDITCTLSPVLPQQPIIVNMGP